MKPTALITGSAIRLGRVIAIGLAEKGYQIAVHYNRSQQEALKTRDRIKEIGVDVDIFPFAFEKTDQFEALICQVKNRFSNLSLLVNNASAYIQSPILSTDYHTFDSQFSANLRAPFFLSKYFAIHCQEGNIINIIDNKVSFNQNEYAAYLLTKKSLVDFTKMAALELAPNIRVNGISPGVTMPGVSRSSEYIQWRQQSIPLNQTGKPSNIIKAIDCILDNDFMTGEIITIDGGEGLTNTGKHAGNYHDPSGV